MKSSVLLALCALCAVALADNLQNVTTQPNPSALPRLETPQLKDPTDQMMPPSDMPEYHFAQPSNEASTFGSDNEYKIEYKPLDMNQGLPMDKNYRPPTANIGNINSRLPNEPLNPNQPINSLQWNTNLPTTTMPNLNMNMNPNVGNLNNPNVLNPTLLNQNNPNVNTYSTQPNPTDAQNNPTMPNFQPLNLNRPMNVPNVQPMNNVNEVPTETEEYTVDRRIKHVRLNDPVDENKPVEELSSNSTDNSTNTSAVPTQRVYGTPLGSLGSFGGVGGINSGWGGIGNLGYGAGFGSNSFGGFGSNNFGSSFGSRSSGFGSSGFGSELGGLNSGWGAATGIGRVNSDFGNLNSFSQSGLGSGWGGQGGWGSSGFGDSFGNRGWGSQSSFGSGLGSRNSGYWKKR